MTTNQTISFEYHSSHNMLYNSMIGPHINYCILAWGYEQSRIFKLQKKAMRIINVSKYNAHTNPLLKNTKLLKIEDILNLNELKFYYQFENGLLPNNFKKGRNWKWIMECMRDILCWVRIRKFINIILDIKIICTYLEHIINMQINVEDITFHTP